MDLASPTPGPCVTPGATVSHYRIVSEIGRGGMGVVYRAVDLNLQREVALKCVRPDRAASAEHGQRLLREARAASSLSHPNIVTILEAFEHQGAPWIAMEYVDGCSLRTWLAERGPPPLEVTLQWAEELADALRAAHRKRILHRDVNPNNVLITSDGRARLTDFGLARVYTPPAEASQAATETPISVEGRVVGTPGYMAPEQVLGRPLDFRSDIFSVGAVLYEMAVAKPAFVATAEGHFVDAILHRTPAAMSKLNPEVPEEFERIVRKALSKRADERYQDARDLLADLRTLRRKTESGAQDASPVEPRRAPRRWLMALALLGAVAVGVAAAFIWVGQRVGIGDPLPASAPRRAPTGTSWSAEPALAPAGNLIAYTASDGGAPDVWVVDIHGGEPVRLTRDPASDRDPAWFPDGSAVAFVSDRGGQEAIWKVPPLGGAEVLLVPQARDPAVSPDGTRIAFARAGASGSSRIFVAPLADVSTATALTGDGDGLWDHRRPAWSPDGRTLCYQDFRDLWVVPAQGGRARRLTNEHATDAEPVWSPSGRHIYFSSRRDGAEAIWRIQADGRNPQRLTLGTGPEGRPSISRDGARLAFAAVAPTRKIVLLDRRTGRVTNLTPLGDQISPAFAPDKSFLAFVSDWEGKYALWVQSLDDSRPAGPPRRLTDQPGTVATLAISPDCRWIAFHRVLENQRDIWIVSAAGGAPRNFTNHPAIDVHPSWSPDGGKLAFMSDRDGGSHIWVQPVANGEPAGPATRITQGDSTDSFPSWSPDGEAIAFLRQQGPETDVWVVNARDGGPPRRITTGAQATLTHWDGSSTALLVSGSWGASDTTLKRVRIDAGGAEPLSPAVTFGGAEALGDFDVAADGALIAYVEEKVHGELWTLEARDGSF